MENVNALCSVTFKLSAVTAWPFTVAYALGMSNVTKASFVSTDTASCEAESEDPVLAAEDAEAPLDVLAPVAVLALFSVAVLAVVPAAVDVSPEAYDPNELNVRIIDTVTSIETNLPIVVL